MRFSLTRIDRRGADGWRIRYVKDGKRHTVTVTGTQDDAIAQRDLIRADIARNSWTAPATTTFGEWAQTWVAQYLMRAVSARSYDRQKGIVDRHLAPLTKVPLQKLGPVRINELYRQLEATGLHPSTVHYVHVVLGSCLKAAVKIGALARNPARDASPPKVSTQSGGRSLTQSELGRLLAAFGGDPLFFVVALAVGTGARINELLALEWSAVDWDLKTMRIDAALKPTAGLRFHDLRHTHATLLLQAGVPVAAVSARLGHANAAVTLGIYSHATTDAEAAAAQVAGSLLSSALKGG